MAFARRGRGGTLNVNMNTQQGQKRPRVGETEECGFMHCRGVNLSGQPKPKPKPNANVDAGERRASLGIEEDLRHRILRSKRRRVDGSGRVHNSGSTWRWQTQMKMQSHRVVDFPRCQSQSQSQGLHGRMPSQAQAGGFSFNRGTHFNFNNGNGGASFESAFGLKRKHRRRGRARIPTNTNTSTSTQQNFRIRELTRTRTNTDSKDFAGPKTLAQIKEEKLRRGGSGEDNEKNELREADANASDKKPCVLSPGSEIEKVECLQSDGYAPNSTGNMKPMEVFDAFIQEKSSAVRLQEYERVEDTTMNDAVDDLDDEEEDDFCTALGGIFSSADIKFI